MKRQLIHALLALGLAIGLLASAPANERAPATSKAEEILQHTIEALGGESYLGVRDMMRRGRLYSFVRGNLANPGDRFIDYVKFPGKEWLQFGKKGKTVFLNNGEQGWELDRQGVREQLPEQIERFKEGNLRDLEYLLRFRIHQEKFQYYYLGREFFDNRRVHVLELVDEKNESIKLFIDARTYLPVKRHHREQEPLTGEWVEVDEYYGKYINVQGIQTPMQLTRERGGFRSLEVHFSKVEYNHGVPDEQFTRAALEKHWGKVK